MIARLRWRLASLIAPGRIMSDPLHGATDGVALLVREGGLGAWFLPTKFRLKGRSRLLPRRYPATISEVEAFESATVYRFVGVVER